MINVFFSVSVHIIFPAESMNRHLIVLFLQVSVLGLLSHLRLDFDLHALLFGESVLNDAVAIVLTQ